VNVDYDVNRAHRAACTKNERWMPEARQRRQLSAAKEMASLAPASWNQIASRLQQIVRAFP